LIGVALLCFPTGIRATATESNPSWIEPVKDVFDSLHRKTRTFDPLNAAHSEYLLELYLEFESFFLEAVRTHEPAARYPQAVFQLIHKIVPYADPPASHTDKEGRLLDPFGELQFNELTFSPEGVLSNGYGDCDDLSLLALRILTKLGYEQGKQVVILFWLNVEENFQHAGIAYTYRTDEPWGFFDYSFFVNPSYDTLEQVYPFQTGAFQYVKVKHYYKVDLLDSSNIETRYFQVQTPLPSLDTFFLRLDLSLPQFARCIRLYHHFRQFVSGFNEQPYDRFMKYLEFEYELHRYQVGRPMVQTFPILIHTFMKQVLLLEPNAPFEPPDRLLERGGGNLLSLAVWAARILSYQVFTWRVTVKVIELMGYQLNSDDVPQNILEHDPMVIVAIRNGDQSWSFLDRMHVRYSRYTDLRMALFTSYPAYSRYRELVSEIKHIETFELRFGRVIRKPDILCSHE